MKPCFVSIAAVTALLITACNGSSSSSPFFPSNTSYVRIANGSPDAGDVAVQLNGSTVDGSLAYASITSFQKVGVGSQTLNIYPAGMVSGKPLATTTFSVNAGVDTTVVLSGERHPSYGAKANVALTVFTEQPYNTLPGGAAVNFYNSAPVISDDLHRNTVQFGYSIDSAPGDHSLGTAQPVGGSTDPQGLPSDALNVPITLYAKNYKA